MLEIFIVMKALYEPSGVGLHQRLLVSHLSDILI